MHQLILQSLTGVGGIVQVEHTGRRLIGPSSIGAGAGHCECFAHLRRNNQWWRWPKQRWHLLFFSSCFLMLPRPRCPYILWLKSMTGPSHSQVDWSWCSERTWTRGECVWHASVFVRIEAAASETTREKSSVVYHATSSFHPFQINIACHPGGHFIGSLANQCRWPVLITCFLLYCSINPYQSSNIIPKKRGAKDLLD